MNKIFIGMLLVFLDFNLDIGAMRIGLIPDFLGYIFILQGLAQLSGKSERFSKVRPFAFGMLIMTALHYLLGLLGLSLTLGIADYLLSLLLTIVSLYVAYGIVMGIRDIESAQGHNLAGAQLLSRWRLLAILSVLVYFLFLIPILNIVCIIASFVIGIVFLVSLNTTKKLYNSYNL